MLPRTKFDVVVNMAGTMPAHADTNMMPYVHSIVVGTVNLCNWMDSIGTKRIIFNTTPSDVAEHWEKQGAIDDDASRSFPKNGNDHAVYAICKRAACDILEHKSILDGYEPCIFRHFMVYGWHPDAYYYLNGNKKMLPWRYMIRRCINGQDIEVYGNPKRVKELLYIKDFADAVVSAAESHACGIFNLPGYKPYSFDEMVDGIIQTFSRGNVKKVHNPDMPDTPQILLSGKKSEEVLGWKAKWTWQSACEDMKLECINNPIELMWGEVDKEDRIDQS